jgi:diguanylate cyclase (GGDEF)-like protein
MLAPGAAPTPGLLAMRTIIEEGFNFAASPTGPEGATHAASISAQAERDIPEAWGAEVRAFHAAWQGKTDMLTYAGLGVCAALLAAAALAAFTIVAPAMACITQQREQLEHMAATDQLTGFYNRAMLFKVAGMLLSSARRHKHEITALAVDIDDFRKINDTFGRGAGDGAVKAVAEAMGGFLRTSDAMGRLAGSEFAVFLPSTDEYRAGLVADKLRAAVEQLPFSVKDRIVLLRVSIGVAQFQDSHRSTDELLRAAEAALRFAMESGGNRVATWTAAMKAAPVTPPSDNATASG